MTTRNRKGPTIDEFCHFVAEAARNAAVKGLHDVPEGPVRNFMLECLAENADAIVRMRTYEAERAACL